MSPRRLLIALAAVAAALALFLGGVVVGGHPEATGLTQLREPLRGLLLGESGETLPAQVLDALEERYYEDVDLERLERASVRRIIAALDDPYTAYLTPEELRALRDRNDGAYFGVGLQVAQRDRAIVVTRVFEDSPAARAGIGVGDRLVAVDGRP
ncbi:MAG: PDZ domain-containing protein, partial [Phycisphaerales bacterium]|nr:PDZ domain-containing protein [Phycisphaerales bacterium]